MIKLLHLKKTTKQGFTLIEIMIAMLVIGILAAGSFGLYNYWQGRANTMATQQKLQTLKSGIDQFRAAAGSLPKDLSDLVERPQGVKRWSGPYVPEEGNPLEDAWGEDFVYEVKGKNNYELYSEGSGKRIDA